jgi:hypothetical protein
MNTAKTLLAAALTALLAAAGLAAPATSSAQTGPSVSIGGEMAPPDGKRINSWEEYRFSAGSGAVAVHCGIDLADGAGRDERAAPGGRRLARRGGSGPVPRVHPPA